MTEYVVLVKSKGGDGFQVIGKAEAHNPKSAQEAVLLEKSAPAEGEVATVPARSWDPRPYVLKHQPTLELG